MLVQTAAQCVQYDGPCVAPLSRLGDGDDSSVPNTLVIPSICESLRERMRVRALSPDRRRPALSASPSPDSPALAKS